MMVAAWLLLVVGRVAVAALITWQAASPGMDSAIGAVGLAAARLDGCMLKRTFGGGATLCRVALVVVGA